MVTDLSSRCALITGAGNGIGAAIARELTNCGAGVALLDRDTTALEALVAALRRGGATAVAITADVGCETDVAAAFEFALAELGALDLVVNNAATQSYGTVETLSPAAWEEILRVNLTGPFLVSRAAVPHLRQRGGGAVVNIGSVQSLAAGPNTVAYVTSKHGIIGLTRSMALDLADDGIRVNCVCPGAVDTPMLRREAGRQADPQALLDGCAAVSLVGRLGRPEEIAAMVAFLCSDAASFITGSVQVVDGGMLTALPGVRR